MKTWSTYTPTLIRHILNPTAMGTFQQTPLLHVTGLEETPGNTLRLHLLIDPEDGVIADARFQAFGDTALIGVADLACAKLLRKTYIQANHLHLNLPPSTNAHFNLVLAAIHDATSQCGHISATPLELPTAPSELPPWDAMSHDERLAAIRATIERDIQPFIALDAGGVSVLSLEKNEIVIAYEGSCTSCHSATGSTLTAIQQILRTHLHPDLTVRPDLSLLNQPGY